METNLIFCTECIEILERVTSTTVKAEKKNQPIHVVYRTKIQYKSLPKRLWKNLKLLTELLFPTIFHAKITKINEQSIASSW